MPESAVNVLLGVRLEVQAEGHHAPPKVHPLPHLLLVCTARPHRLSCEDAYRRLPWQRHKCILAASAGGIDRQAKLGTTISALQMRVSYAK